VLDHRRLDKCTRQRLFVRDGVAGFKVGDAVELDFDGRARRIVEIDTNEDAIVIDPPLDRKPLKGSLVADWADRTKLQLDLRLRPGSPGAKLAADGGPVGSRLAIAAYQAGDFNSDGQRDPPPLPDWLLAD
jgi:hypothetical protein